MRSIALPTLMLLGLVTMPRAARADLTSWLSFGGGYSFEKNQLTSTHDRATAFSATLGVGTTPTSPFVVGGVFRSTTHFTLGTDVALAARLATGGFARGDWGIALDAGAAMRWWGNGVYGRYPLQGVLLLGAPWGVQLAVGADVFNLGGNPQSQGGFALLEIDLLRLTLMRQGSTDSIWKNPSPAGGRITP